jgi:hypothetical protein
MYAGGCDERDVDAPSYRMLVVGLRERDVPPDRDARGARDLLDLKLIERRGAAGSQFGSSMTPAFARRREPRPTGSRPFTAVNSRAVQVPAAESMRL